MTDVFCQTQTGRKRKRKRKMIDFKEKIAGIIAKTIPDADPEMVRDIVEVPQDQKMGDYAFPCFRLAKIFRKAPQMIAADIAEGIKGDTK